MAEELNGSYASVDSICNSVIADLGEGGTHNYDRYLHWALECLQDFYMDSARETKTVKLTVNDYNAIDWPSDYVDWVKIGYQSGDRVALFSINDDLASSWDENGCGDPIKNSVGDPASLPNNAGETGVSGYWFHNYINNHGENMGGFFGSGGGRNRLGEFKIVRERKQILFDSCVSVSEIYLEYIGTGFEPCETSEVSQYAKKMINHYIHWRRNIFKYGANSGEAQAWERLYYEEYRKVRARLSNLTPAKVIEISRRNYKLSIKQ